MKHIVVGTAGHIDHGKSSLVQALTGTDPDRLIEEKTRGITIDLGFAHWDAPGLSVSFVDVPGHERFVKNMLAGASGLDAVMLVVAADESVMPQTREHFEICRLLQVPAGIVAVTKIDVVDAEMIDLVAADVRDLVRGSFLEGAPIVPVSARSGAGLDALRAQLEAIGHHAAERRSDGPARLPIDRVFSMKGFGTVVTGTLVSGELAVDSASVVLPGGRPAKIRGVQVHGRREARAVAGQRVAANLGGVETSDVARGQTLASPGAFAPTRVIDARIELLESARPLRHGARVRFHQGTSETLGRIALSSVVSAGADVPDTPVAVDVPPGESAYVRLRLETPVVVTRGDRVIIRAYSPPDTIGGGVVLDPHPPRGGIRTEGARARFRELDPATAPDPDSAAERALLLMASEAAGAGVPVAALSSRLGLSGPGAARAVETLERSGRLTVVGASLVGASPLAALADRLVQIAGEYHRAFPLEAGIPREEARERLFSRAAPGVFEHVLDRLVHARLVTATDRIALAAHRVDDGSANAAARDAILRQYLDAGLRPPDQASLAGPLGLTAPAVTAMVALLVRQRALVRVETLVFHEAALRRLKDDLRALKAASPGATVTLDVAAFKERYGVTRKYAIPLLEYLDRERVTRRVGESRVVI